MYHPLFQPLVSSYARREYDVRPTCRMEHGVVISLNAADYPVKRGASCVNPFGGDFVKEACTHRGTRYIPAPKPTLITNEQPQLHLFHVCNPDRMPRRWNGRRHVQYLIHGNQKVNLHSCSSPSCRNSGINQAIIHAHGVIIDGCLIWINQNPCGCQYNL
jgi:hypothetical protein